MGSMIEITMECSVAADCSKAVGCLHTSSRPIVKHACRPIVKHACTTNKGGGLLCLVSSGKRVYMLAF